MCVFLHFLHRRQTRWLPHPSIDGITSLLSSRVYLEAEKKIWAATLIRFPCSSLSCVGRNRRGTPHKHRAKRKQISNHYKQITLDNE